MHLYKINRKIYSFKCTERKPVVANMGKEMRSNCLMAQAFIFTDMFWKYSEDVTLKYCKSTNLLCMFYFT